ncbi:MAG TPA: lasso peptide biosynthesis B2 protein [Bryobacteraceae bacterium]|nr:lasso peptide biosynthesis B2 protein [Bryobacteraceae bacterium]
MRKATKFLVLPRTDQWLLLQALAIVTAMRVCLALLPFRPGRRRSRLRAAPQSAGPCPRRIAWAIEKVGGCLGSATCLARARAAEIILRWRGYPARVTIGVMPGERQTEESGLIAHAWVEFEGEVLVGGPDIDRYTPLLTWSN